MEPTTRPTPQEPKPILDWVSTTDILQTTSSLCHLFSFLNIPFVNKNIPKKLCEKMFNECPSLESVVEILRFMFGQVNRCSRVVTLDQLHQKCRRGNGENVFFVVKYNDGQCMTLDVDNQEISATDPKFPTRLPASEIYCLGIEQIIDVYRISDRAENATPKRRKQVVANRDRSRTDLVKSHNRAIQQQVEARWKAVQQKRDEAAQHLLQERLNLVEKSRKEIMKQLVKSHNQTVQQQMEARWEAVQQKRDEAAQRLFQERLDVIEKSRKEIMKQLVESHNQTVQQVEAASWAREEQQTTRFEALYKRMEAASQAREECFETLYKRMEADSRVNHQVDDDETETDDDEIKRRLGAEKCNDGSKLKVYPTVRYVCTVDGCKFNSKERCGTEAFKSAKTHMVAMKHDVTGDGIIIVVPNSFQVAYDKKKQKMTTFTKRKAINQLQMEPAAKRVPPPCTSISSTELVTLVSVETAVEVEKTEKERAGWASQKLDPGNETNKNDGKPKRGIDMEWETMKCWTKFIRPYKKESKKEGWSSESESDSSESESDSSESESDSSEFGSPRERKRLVALLDERKKELAATQNKVL